VTEARSPRAGVDYPATWPAFEAWFPDEEACRAYLAGLRWPEGFRCPDCGGADAWATGRGLWMCRGCGRQTSVTAGTIFHRTHYPLRTWFAAAWFVCAQKTGTSALGLQRVLGFGSYETAWTWMHKLRRAMVRPDRDRLGGPGVTVELDQTFVGGRAPVGRARYDSKAEVTIAVERRHPKGLGRIRMRHIGSQTRKADIFAFAADTIAAGTVLYTDGDRLYGGLADQLAVTHQPIALVHAPDPAHALLPAVHRVASLLKRWLAGTLHYGQSSAHLDYYLDEFTFRFNRRTSNRRGLLFYRLLQQAVNTDPHPLHALVAHTEPELLTPGGHWS
jgi:ISXO2-like transposase domain/Transposase zinc-ribbon domain